MLEVTFEETFKESRKVSISKDNITQTIVGIFCGNFLEDLEPNNFGLYSDDVVVMKVAYLYLPNFYEVPTYEGFTIVLTLSSIELEQLNNTTWSIRATYDIPQKGGKGGAGQGTEEIGNVGPDANENGGEGWGENFTQISCSFTAATRNRSFSLGTLACQRNVNLPAANVPYPPGRPAPIGHTNDGVAGAEVYEREFSFNITSYFSPDRLTYGYSRLIAATQTTLNAGVFFGYPGGSVLFLEADFSGDLYQVVPVTFVFKQRNNFRFSQDLANAIGDPFTPFSFDTFFEPEFADTEVLSGWSEIDYRYLPLPDDGSKMKLQKPVLRTIHQLYQYSNFGVLGI